MAVPVSNAPTEANARRPAVLNRTHKVLANQHGSSQEMSDDFCRPVSTQYRI